MGMYTQVRGWLNIDSIGHPESFYEIQDKLQGMIDEYQEKRITSRSWVARDTIAARGSNGSTYIFFGTELKNYDEDAEEWIKYLIATFPSAEGRIDFQYETEEYHDENSKSKYWLIRDGMVIESARTSTWCKGYGNSYDKLL
jgi:hypothetical protein